jgi:hypothetical protein
VTASACHRSLTCLTASCRVIAAPWVHGTWEAPVGVVPGPFRESRFVRQSVWRPHLSPGLSAVGVAREAPREPGCQIAPAAASAKVAAYPIPLSA